MQVVRMGIVGPGYIGQHHAGYLRGGLVEGAVLSSFASRSESGKEKVQTLFPGLPVFSDIAELAASKTCDAVIIATPHMDHPRQVIAALENGLHVLVEKPLAASIKAAGEVITTYKKYPHLKFGIMHNQRTYPIYQKIKQLISAGELGTISRITWIITDWFRTHAYYASNPWRATWKGEGGGVLLNQCPHNLDLLQWITGMMPSRITAVAFTGKTHPIEVEDEVSAILEYPGNAIGHFITTTGEFPGSNRLEIAGTRGRVIAENSALSFTRTEKDTQEFNRTSSTSFGSPKNTTEKFEFPEITTRHHVLTADFVDVIRHEKPNHTLLAPGPEGMASLELANAMLMSGLTHQPISLPLQPDIYENFLQTLMANSTRKPPS